MSELPTARQTPGPTLAFVYQSRSVDAMALADAARDICSLLWIIDTSGNEIATMSRLLRKLGGCVDVAGLSLDEATTAIAEFEPSGIMTLGDESLVWTSEIASRLHLNFFSPATAAQLTDKHLQRDAFAAAGVTVPRSWVIAPGDPTSRTAALEAVTFPAVLKPRQGKGSRDTVRVDSAAELKALWTDLDDFDAVPVDFVLEEYIRDATAPVAGKGFASYVSVESFVCDGVITHLAINGRMPPAFQFRETGFFIPSELDSSLEVAVLTVASDAIGALGISLGCLHTEIKLTPTGPVVIEVNGRIGGGVPELLEASSGVRIYEIALRLALGEVVTTDAMPRCERIAYLFYVHAPQEMTTISNVDGLRELREVPGVDDISLNRGPGQRVDWREGNLGFVFSVFGTVKSHDELRDVYRLTSSLAQISGE